MLGAQRGTFDPDLTVKERVLAGRVAAMAEFISVSASSYEPAALAAKLTEKSAEAWTVVSIVPTGSEIVAFLSRGATAVAAAGAEQRIAASTSGPSPVVEPAGWGAATSAPAPQASTNVTPQPASSTPLGLGNTSVNPITAAGATPATSSTPAGWYHDPSGRYELRYWDGSQWTEHVSRGGQQFTDPPVA